MTLRVLSLLGKHVAKFSLPSVTEISLTNNPFKVLVSCILSLRTKDLTTIKASKRLFQVADNPHSMVKLSINRLRKLIYPVGFYRNKARVILTLSHRLIKEFQGNVPDSLEALLSFNGVGRKTANLVLGLGFGIPAICVDTHVHRISNRLGWVRTNTPEETEEELKKIIPKRWWVKLNTVMVSFGQNICLPVSPRCSRCKINQFCAKKGIKVHR